MRSETGFTAWEAEAARRREVVATDYPSVRPEDGRAFEPRNGERGRVPVPSWLASVGRIVGGASSPAPETQANCQSQARVMRPGA